MRRNDHGYGKWDMNYGPDGFEKSSTDRNPDNFKYKSNLFHHTMWELRHIYGDALYQIFRRSHRLGDKCHTYVLPTVVTSLYLLSSQHIAFLNGFVWMFFATIARTLSKTEEPRIDEIWMRDFLLSHEKIKKVLKVETMHVIDHVMEYDKGNDNPYFPEYKGRLARFFNVDCNTCTGFIKFGDLESGAIITVHFKTMPYSAQQYWYSDPFLVYDMVIETSLNGNYEVEHTIKAEDTLKTKRIFIPLF